MGYSRNIFDDLCPSFFYCHGLCFMCLEQRDAWKYAVFCDLRHFSRSINKTSRKYFKTLGESDSRGFF
ncbi:hypothetical protein EfmAA290_18880 [Enterococcus faecium]|nr:hypothetical protein EfmAA290_18880 [Enterococcus faecium]